MSFKKPYLAIALVGVALASGGAWWLQNKPAEPKTEVSSAPGSPTVTGQPAPAAGGATSAAPGGASGSGAPQKPPAVEVAKVEKAMLVDETQSVGSLRSFQGVMLRPEVGGRVSQILFKDGQKVKKGQLLYSLTISCLLHNWHSPKPSCPLHKPTTLGTKNLLRKTSSASAPWMNLTQRFKWPLPNWRWPKPRFNA